MREKAFAQDNHLSDLHVRQSELYADQDISLLPHALLQVLQDVLRLSYTEVYRCRVFLKKSFQYHSVLIPDFRNKAQDHRRQRL